MPEGLPEVMLNYGLCSQPHNLHFIVFPPRLDYKPPLCAQKTLYKLSTLACLTLWKSPVATVYI